MKLTHTLFALLAAVLLPGWLPAFGAEERPNILLIVSDDHGYADIGFQGCKDIPTPHLDGLARGGVHCTSGYVSHPFCSPTRAGLMTGRYQQRFGHQNNPFYNPADHKEGLPLGEKLLPEFLGQAGYVTGWVGKWHLGAAPEFHPEQRGFAETFGFIGGGHRYLDWTVNPAAEYTVPIERNGKPVAVTEHLTGAFGKEAAAFVQRHAGKPWFLYLAFNAPHTPHEPTAERLARFSSIENPVRRKYAAQVSLLDDAIGGVIDTLRVTGQETNTLVFFFSDNGGPTNVNGSCNAPLRGAKGDVYEGGVRVPFVVRWPAKLPAGKSCELPVSSLDVFATALGAAGVDMPKGRTYDSVNLIPFLRGEQVGAPHDRLFWRTSNNQWAVRQGSMKLVRQQGRPDELYIVQPDIGEKSDLLPHRAGDPSQLVSALEAWDKELIEPAFPGAAARKPGKKPNVLFIAIDDLNDWVGCLAGHPQARTPNMDRLAARGTLFSNAHCQAPLCNPSRSSLLTGLRPSTTGIYGLAPGLRDVDATRDCVTLPQAFARHGYFTAAFGKVFHDGSIPEGLRTNEFRVWGPAPGMPLPKQKFVHTPDDMRAMDWGAFPADDREQADWKTADSVIAQLAARPKDKPFFLACGFRLPHVPCFASQKWFDLIPAESDLALPAVKDNERAGTPDFSWYLHWKLPEPRLSWLKQSGQWRPLVRAYLASTAFMDSQLGRVLDALDASGVADSTVVVLWSDNGWHLGEKLITGKNSLWDRSTRVPLIFAGPGVARAARCAQPAELLDLYPTLLALCGLPARSGLEGHSLVPQLKDAAAPRPWPAITTHNAGNHAVRTARWRYIRYADGSEELYDMPADPHEWNNLAKDPQQAAVIRDLARWLPALNRPPAPGSAQRILERKDGAWCWEGKPIDPAQRED